MNTFDARLARRLTKLDGRIRFGSVEDVSAAALAQFYAQMFPDRAPFLIRHWRWLYRDSGRASASPMLAIDGDRVAGQGGFLAATLQRGSDRRDAVWMMDFAILPEYQRGILGGALLKLAAVASPLRVAFLNERSWALADKLGWKTHFMVTSYQLPLRPERLARLQTMAKETRGLATGAQIAGFAVRAASRAVAIAATDIEVLPATRETLAPFSTARPGEALCAARSAGFLEWRVLAHPLATRYVVMRAGFVQAIARVMCHAGCRRLHLLTLLADPRDRRGLSRFFGGVIRWALAAEVDTILLLTSVPEIAAVAARWLPVKSKQRFAYHADDESGMTFLGGAGQTWELLDSDFEMMCESAAQ